MTSRPARMSPVSWVSPKQRTGDSPSGDSPTARLHGGWGMRCSDPIAAAVLADYWLAALADPEEEAGELHLLDCDRCGARLREVIALAEGVRKLARGNTMSKDFT